MSKPERITPKLPTPNSKTGYVKVVNSSAEARLLRLFKGDKATLNLLIETGRRNGQPVDSPIAPLPSSSNQSNPTSTSKSSNKSHDQKPPSSSVSENFEALMKQRAQQIIAMSIMSQGMTDPPKTPNGDDISSMTEEEILSSFLKYFGQRVGKVCSECYESIDFSGEHKCTSSNADQREKKGCPDMTKLSEHFLGCTCFLNDDIRCMDDLGDNDGVQAALDHSVPLPLDWATLRDQVLTTQAPKKGENVKKQTKCSSHKPEACASSTTQTSHSTYQAASEGSGSVSKNNALEDEGGDSTVCDQERKEQQGRIFRLARDPKGGNLFIQSVFDAKMDSSRLQTDAKRDQLHERQKQAKQMRQDHKIRMKEKKKTEKLQEELLEHEKLEILEAERLKAILEEEQKSSDKAKEEARRRSTMDKADQAFRSYLYDRTQNCDVEMVKCLLNAPVELDQEQSRDPPVPATSAAQSLDLWQYYERNREDNSMVSVSHGIQETLLHVAVQAGSLALTELLLSHGASLVAVDSAGRTPLHTATEHANPNCIGLVKLLIEHGPIRYIDSQTMHSQDTCLHIAAAAQNAPLVKYLLDMHAKTHFVNANGLTAEQVARMQLKHVEPDPGTTEEENEDFSRDTIDDSRKIIAYFIQARILMQENVAQKERLEEERRREEAIKMERENQQDDKIRRKQEEKLLKEARKREQEEELLKNLVKSAPSNKKKKKAKSKSKVATPTSDESRREDALDNDINSASKMRALSVDSTSESTGSLTLSDTTDDNKTCDQTVHTPPDSFVPVPHSFEEFIYMQQRMKIQDTRNEQHHVRFPSSHSSLHGRSIPIHNQPVGPLDRPIQHSMIPYQQQQALASMPPAPIQFESEDLTHRRLSNSNSAYTQYQAASNMDSKVICPLRNNVVGYKTGSPIQANGSLLGWNSFSPEIWGPPHPTNDSFAKPSPQQRNSLASSSPHGVNQNLPRFSLFG